MHQGQAATKSLTFFPKIHPNLGTKPFPFTCFLLRIKLPFSYIFKDTNKLVLHFPEDKCNGRHFPQGRSYPLRGHRLLYHARQHIWTYGVLSFISSANKRITCCRKYCRYVTSQYLKCCSWEPRLRKLYGRASQDLRFLVHDSRSVITSMTPK